MRSSGKDSLVASRDESLILIAATKKMKNHSKMFLALRTEDKIAVQLLTYNLHSSHMRNIR